MNNRKYLETLKVCMQLPSINEIYEDILVESKVDLKEYINVVRRLFRTDGLEGEKIVEILENLARFINYDFEDIREEELGVAYSRFLKTYMNIFSVHKLRQLKDFEVIIKIGLTRRFKLIKVYTVQSWVIKLNSKVYELETTTVRKTMTFEINNKDENVGMIGIKSNGEGDFIKTPKIEDSVKMLKEIIGGGILDKYEMVVLPSVSMKLNDILDNYDLKHTSNKELLDLLFIANNMYFVEGYISYTDIELVRESDINVGELYTLIHNSDNYEDDTFNFLGLVVMVLEKVSKDKREVYMQEIKECLDYRVHNIKMFNRQTLYHLDFQNECAKDIDTFLENLKRIDMSRVQKFIGLNYEGKKITARRITDSNMFATKLGTEVCYNRDVIITKNDRIETYKIGSEEVLKILTSGNYKFAILN